MVVDFKHKDIRYQALGTYEREERIFNISQIYYYETNIYDVLDSLGLLDEFHESIIDYI